MHDGVRYCTLESTHRKRNQGNEKETLQPMYHIRKLTLSHQTSKSRNINTLQEKTDASQPLIYHNINFVKKIYKMSCLMWSKLRKTKTIKILFQIVWSKICYTCLNNMPYYQHKEINYLCYFVDLPMLCGIICLN